MSDHGEKIVNLAREMLRSDFPLGGMETTELKKAQVSLKALCLTAFLAAFGGVAFTHCFDEDYRPANHYERVELDALLFYAARVKTLDEDRLRQEVRDRLGLPSFDDITADDYRRARDYLRARAG